MTQTVSIFDEDLVRPTTPSPSVSPKALPRSPKLTEATGADEQTSGVTPPPVGTVPGLLAEVSGVVVGANLNHVRVKLGEETVVEFPRELFGDEGLIQIGMPLKYQIKKRSNGTRFQQFIMATPTGTKESMAELEALLADVERD
jgi:hypothetical protein